MRGRLIHFVIAARGPNTRLIGVEDCSLFDVGGIESLGVPRLLPRHEMPFDLEIEWNVVKSHRFLGKDTETSVAARVLDLSLDGALIEVPMPTDHRPGEQISIRLSGEDGRWSGAQGTTWHYPPPTHRWLQRWRRRFPYLGDNNLASWYPSTRWP